MIVTQVSYLNPMYLFRHKCFDITIHYNPLRQLTVYNLFIKRKPHPVFSLQLTFKHNYKCVFYIIEAKQLAITCHTSKVSQNPSDVQLNAVEHCLRNLMVPNLVVCCIWYILQVFYMDLVALV